LITLLLGICAGCHREPSLSPLPPCYTWLQPSKIPLIIEGEVIEDSHAVGPTEISEWGDAASAVQLWKVRVREDQVLQGELDQGFSKNDLSIFYFANDRYVGSAAHLLHMYSGHAAIFLLQRDRKILRTICDGWAYCVFSVKTGPHQRYKVDPTIPIEDTIVGLMLSRGDNTTDDQMADAIWHPELRWGTAPVMAGLRKLSENDKSRAIRELASARLNSLAKTYGKGTRIAICQ
jgi:hypothetical protein